MQMMPDEAAYVFVILNDEDQLVLAVMVGELVQGRTSRQMLNVSDFKNGLLRPCFREIKGRLNLAGRGAVHFRRAKCIDPSATKSAASG
jgi:hypothetical protein